MIAVKRIIFDIGILTLLITIALTSGMVVGSVVYWVMQSQSILRQNLSARQMPSRSSQTLRVVDVQTLVTSAVDKVAPAVVTITNHLTRSNSDPFST